MSSFIKNWLRDDILNMNSYQVADATNLIKLDAMESPYEIDEETQSQLNQLYKNAHINRYPNTEAKNLKQQCKSLMNIDDELDILLGNGSDELIQLLALACDTNDVLMSFEPGFMMYQIIAKWTHLKYVGVKLNDDFSINLEKTITQIKETQPKIIFISYPNNPTANLFNRNDIIKIIKNTSALVVLDEAYYAYADDSFINDIKDYNNLVVLRTISKIGFAGLRLGFLIAKSDVVIQLNKLRMPYNIGSLSQITASFLLKKDYVTKTIIKTIEQRDIVFNSLKTIKNLEVYETHTNFILFKTSKADKLFNYLKDNGILIKNLNYAINNCLRVTIGTSSENQQFISLVIKFYDK